MMATYYNEIEPFAAQWLRNLIAAGHIAAGDVDERSIREVHPADIIGYTQCHFFAGIGVWSHVLRRAGWPDDRPVWTGSCPCQPFSAAGKRQGTADDRHLWPEFYRLITAHHPVTVFGEQVASKDGLAWLDIVHADLETAGYTVGAVDTCAASFGAPHIRQRLYFVADAQYSEWRAFNGPEQDERDGQNVGRTQTHGLIGTRGQVCELADTERTKQPWNNPEERRSVGRGESGDVGDSGKPRLQGRELQSRTQSSEQAVRARGATSGFWCDATWLPCIDGKARAVEPGTFPLAHGVAARVGRLRAYGNAIVAPQAAEIIKAYMDCRP